MKRGVILLLVSAAAAVALVGWEINRRARWREIADRFPELPAELGAWPAEFRSRLVATHAAAKMRSAAALGELSRLYHANGYLREALACYAALERLEPKEPRWWHRDATIFAGYGDTESALARAERVVALAPDYVAARLRLGDLRLKRGESARAEAIYAEVLRRAEHPHAWLGLARIAVEAEQWAVARARLEKAMALTKGELGTDLIVTVYERLGMREAAAKIRGRAKASGAYRDPADPWLDELVDDCYDAYRLSLAAGVAQRSGDLAAALRWLERATALAPDDVMVRFQLAGVYTEKRDATKAREQLERCTTSAPAFPDAWAHLASWHEQAGDAAGAERVLAAGLAHCPASPALHLMRARLHRRAGRVAEAIAAYRRSIQLRANEAEPHVELATLLLQSGRVAEGGSQLLQALEAEPDHPTALSLLTLSAIAANDEAAAKKWLARVRAQPRVPAEQAQKIETAFRGQFGK